MFRYARLFTCSYKQTVCQSQRYYNSALFVPGSKASTTCAIVTPCFDIDDRFKDIDILENNIKNRNLKIDVAELKKVWDLYKTVENNKLKLETHRVEISTKIKTLSRNNNSDAEIEKLKIDAREVKDSIKAIKEHLWDLEENIVVKILEIPNILHNETPCSEIKIVHSFKEKSNCKSESHIEIGEKLNLINYFNPMMYYLMNEAALYELSVTFYVADFLINHGLVQLSNLDFSKSVVVEGCGLNPDDVFTLEHPDNDKTTDQNFLHLTGSASLMSYMAYHTKNLVPKTNLPLKYFCIGRQYNLTNETENGLFNVSQSTAVEVFIATLDNDEELNKEFKTILNNLIEFYESLGYHFRVVFCVAKDLKKYESLRASIEMYSNNLNEYIEVGHISICDNYVSKRLQFCYLENKVRIYPKIISATVIDFSKFFACVLEQGFIDKTKIIPGIVKTYVQ